MKRKDARPLEFLAQIDRSWYLFLEEWSSGPRQPGQNEWEDSVAWI